jgi:hypothetical protein
LEEELSLRYQLEKKDKNHKKKEKENFSKKTESLLQMDNSYENDFQIKNHKIFELEKSKGINNYSIIFKRFDFSYNILIKFF